MQNSDFNSYFPQDYFHRIQNHGYSFSIGAVIGKASDILKKEMGLFIGYTIVAGLIYFTVALISSCIPILGNLIPSLITTILGAGFYIVAFKIDRADQMVEFSNFFDSFQKAAPLALQGLVTGIFTMIPLVPFLGYLLISGIAIPTGMSGTEEIEAFASSFSKHGIVIGFLGIIGGLASTVISTMYVLAPALIVFSNMDFWAAMETSRKTIFPNIVWVIILFFVLVLINIVGMLLCFIGLLFTVPLTVLSYYALYSTLMEQNGSHGDEGSQGGSRYFTEDTPLDA
jgi:ABC-type multidrug transport system fused ATPase/permease subunit